MCLTYILNMYIIDTERYRGAVHENFLPSLRRMLKAKNAACMAEMVNLLRTELLLVVWENISSTVTFVERYFGRIFCFGNNWL